MALACHAESIGEVPVGAVLVRAGECIAEGWNQPVSRSDVSAHAEIVTLRAAGEKLQNYRLPDTTLYVTLEPCVMCAGSLIHARVKRLVYATTDLKSGAAGSVFDILGSDRLNHRIEVVGGVLQDECAALLRSFFQQRRGRSLDG